VGRTLDTASWTTVHREHPRSPFRCLCLVIFYWGCSQLNTS